MSERNTTDLIARLRSEAMPYWLRDLTVKAADALAAQAQEIERLKHALIEVKGDQKVLDGILGVFGIGDADCDPVWYAKEIIEKVEQLHAAKEAAEARVREMEEDVRDLEEEREIKKQNDFVPVMGIRLRKDVEYTIVDAEIGGAWIEVIRERSDGEFCHIVEPDGMYSRYYSVSGIETTEAHAVSP
jgi:vacuolar-type H+-ATPase subunit I/STV1